MRVFVACHSALSSMPGPLIAAATQAALPGRWVLGPGWPCTHAYVGLRDRDGWEWRLDGEPPGARWRPWNSLHDLDPPRAYWELLGTPEQSDRAVERARALDGVPYGWDDIATHTMQSVLRALPFVRRVSIRPGVRDALRGTLICSAVAREVMLAAGGDAAEVAARLPDLYPERLAQALRAAESSGGIIRRG